MLLQTASAHSHVSLSSSRSHSSTIPFGFSSVSYSPSFPCSNKAVTCSISKVGGFDFVKYDKLSVLKWNALYRRISMMESTSFKSSSVLDHLESEGKNLTKGLLSRTVKELRKSRNYKRALEVHEWMNERAARYEISSSDIAIQLDLISKVHGITVVESYFQKLPDEFRDRNVHAALLNAYAHAKMQEKAESLLKQMENKDYPMSSLIYNVMMTLYMKLKQFENVESVISEMKKKGIKLDSYSYNIWLSSCGSEGALDKMEQVFEQLKLDGSISPNWATFTTMASMYIGCGEFEKAKECLKKAEIRILGRDHFHYQYLLKLYAEIGNKNEVYRIWNLYKSRFQNIRNLGYRAMIHSLITVRDFEVAEKIYDEWLLMKVRFDPRVPNVLLNAYVREGDWKKAEYLFEQIIGLGGKASSRTWEIMGEGHIHGRRISQALSCLKEAFLGEGSEDWMPKARSLLQLLKLCEEEGDMKSRKELLGFLREKGCLEMKDHVSDLGLEGSNGLSSLVNIRVNDDSDDEKFGF